MLEKDRMSVSQEQIRTGNVMGDYVNINKVDESFATGAMQNQATKSRQKNLQDKENESRWSEIDVKSLYTRIEIPGETLDERGKYDYRNFHTAIVRNSALSDSQLIKREDSARKKAQLGNQAKEIDRQQGELFGKKYGGEKRPDNEDVFSKIKKVDISEMSYSSDEEFCEKYAKNYEILRLADDFLDTATYDELSEMTDLNMSKLLLMKQVKADYDNRLEMMTSNYFALLTRDDLRQISKKDGIDAEILGQKNANELEKYLDLVKNVNSKEIFGKGANIVDAFDECKAELLARDKSGRVDLLKRTPAWRASAEADKYSARTLRDLDYVGVVRPADGEAFENEEIAKRHQSMEQGKLRFSEDESQAKEKLGDENSVVKRMRLGKVLEGLSQPGGNVVPLRAAMS